VRGSGLPAGASLRFGVCCNPVPGDRIVGIVEPDGKEITVHTIDCSELAAHEGHDDVWRDLQWTPQADQNTISTARLRVTIRNLPGVLGQVCSIVAEAGGNIAGLHMSRGEGEFFDVDFDIDVRDARHLTNIAAALRACPSVETVERPRG